MELSGLSDAELANLRTKLVDQYAAEMRDGWRKNLRSLLIFVGLLLLVAGIMETLIGGLMHGFGWLVFPGGVAAYFAWREAEEAKSLFRLLERVNAEIGRREDAAEAKKSLLVRGLG